jgi:hypothetical protein
VTIEQFKMDLGRKSEKYGRPLIIEKLSTLEYASHDPNASSRERNDDWQKINSFDDLPKNVAINLRIAGGFSRWGDTYREGMRDKTYEFENIHVFPHPEGIDGLSAYAGIRCSSVSGTPYTNSCVLSTINFIEEYKLAVQERDLRYLANDHIKAGLTPVYMANLNSDGIIGLIDGLECQIHPRDIKVGDSIRVQCDGHMLDGSVAGGFEIRNIEEVRYYTNSGDLWIVADGIGYSTENCLKQYEDLCEEHGIRIGSAQEIEEDEIEIDR